MENAFILLIIFGSALLLSALRLYLSKDPRKTVFFARVHENISNEKAIKLARQIASALLGVGIAVIVYCVIGLFKGA